MNECSRSDPAPKESQNSVIKKVSKTTYKVQQQELDSFGDESEPTIYAISAPVQKPWNPPSGMNFPSPHESSHGLKMFPPAPSIDSKTGL